MIIVNSILSFVLSFSSTHVDGEGRGPEEQACYQKASALFPIFQKKIESYYNEDQCTASEMTCECVQNVTREYFRPVSEWEAREAPCDALEDIKTGMDEIDACGT